MIMSNLMLHLQHSHFASSQKFVRLLSTPTLPIDFPILCPIASFQSKRIFNIATLAHLSPRLGKMLFQSSKFLAKSLYNNVVLANILHVYQLQLH